jgi:hypothetical protein
MSDDHLHFEWMKLYTSAIRNDTKLLMCSLLARAVAFLILTLMSESERRGFLLVNGKKPDEKTLGKLLHTTPRVCRKALPELLKQGVFLEDADGVLYSPRMVRDHAKFLEASANGRKGGGNPALRVLPFDARDTNKGASKATYKGPSKLEDREQRSDVRGTYPQGSVPHAPTRRPSPPKNIRPMIPPFVHTELLDRLGAGETEGDLRTFYERVSAEWKGRVIAEEPPKFWRREFSEWKAPAGTSSKPAGRNHKTDGTVEGLHGFVREMRGGR